MFYLKPDGQVHDASSRVVGFVHDSLFVQQRQREHCHEAYKKGLNPMELEQISELIQKSGGRHR